MGAADPTVVGMKNTVHSVPRPSSVATPEDAAWARRVEAGVIAEAALDGLVAHPPSATRDELAALVEDGHRARLAFADAHVGLVGHVVGLVARRTGLDRDELYQEGVVGLMEAIERYDPARGGFAGFAVPRIRMRVGDAAVTAHGTVGLPARRARTWRAALAIHDTLAAERASRPDAAEVARTLGESVATVRDLLAYRPASSLPDEEPAAAAVRASDLRVISLTVARLLKRLGHAERELLTALYGLDGNPPSTHAEMAERLAVSESTVRRRARCALDVLRGAAASASAA